MRKRKQMIWKWVLGMEAAFCIVFCLLRVKLPGLFSVMVAFPFEQIGGGLRALSLSGAAGNILAIVLYVLIGLVPAVIWLFLSKKKRAVAVDWVLPGLSVLLFLVLYFMINPGLFPTNVPGTGKLLWGCTFYSVFWGYLVIRLLSGYVVADKEKLQNGLIMLLSFLNMIFVYMICGQCFAGLLDVLENVGNSNSFSEVGGELFAGPSELTLTYLFLILHFLVTILPYVCDVAVTFLAIAMLRVLSVDRYAEETVRAVEKLADVCGKALVITILADVGFNILQLLFHRSLYQVDLEIAIPVVSIIFVLAMLLFARYMREDQKLKQDHDLFI